MKHISGLLQDFSISIANTLEILQSYMKPLMYSLFLQKCIPYLYLVG